LRHAEVGEQFKEYLANRDSKSSEKPPVAAPVARIRIDAH
jgi:hypothetical protein